MSLAEMKYEYKMKLTDLLDKYRVPYVAYTALFNNDGTKNFDKVLPKAYQKMTYEECMKYNKNHDGDAIMAWLKNSPFMVMDNDCKEVDKLFQQAIGVEWATPSTSKGTTHKWFLKMDNDASLDLNDAYKNDDISEAPYLKKVDLKYNSVCEWRDAIMVYNDEMEYFDFKLNHPKPVDKNEVKEKPKQQSIPKTMSLRSKDVKEIELMLDLGLLNGKANGKYDDWLSVACAMKRSGASYELFDEFSRIDMTNYDEEKNRKIWDNLKVDEDGYNIGSLKKWCKNYNKELYNKYFNYYLEANILEGEAFKIQEHIKEKLRNLVYVEESWFQYNENLCIWEKTTDPTHYVLSILIKHLDASIAYLAKLVEETDDEKDKKALKGQIEYYKLYEKKFNTCAFTNQFIKLLKTSLRDNDFINKLDKNPNKIAFKNGMLDLETGHFRNRLKYDDYLTGYIDKNYELSTEEQKKWVEDVIHKICNCNEEQAQYYKSILGFSLLGTPHLEKSMFGMVGEKANNGKTTLLASLEKIAPCYIKKMHSEALLKGSTKSHKFLVCFEKARIVYCEEIPNKKLNTDLLKELGDGKEIKNEIMFGTNKSISLCGKLFMISQKPMDFATDKGIETRYKQLQFNNRFLKEDHEDYHLIGKDPTVFQADKKLCEKLEGEYAMALLNVLFQYAQMYLNEKQLKKIPALFAEKTSETLKNNDVLSEWWDDNIEIGNDYKLAKEEVNKKRGNIPLKDLLGFIKDKGFIYIKDSQHKGMKGIWKGIRLVEIIEDVKEE